MNAKFRSYFYRVFQSKLVFTYSKSTMDNTRKMCRICWKLKIKYSERRHWCRSGVVTVNFEKISHCSTTSIVDFKQINLAMATVCFWLAKTYILNIFLVMLQIKSLASYQKNPIKHFDAIVFVKYEICLHIGLIFTFVNLSSSNIIPVAAPKLLCNCNFTQQLYYLSKVCMFWLNNFNIRIFIFCACVNLWGDSL